jgi:tRNA pseudouridine32 synthase/23S rRNA pseudouridine746 synthase
VTTDDAAAYAELAARVAADEAERLAIEEQRAAESRGLMKQVHDSYVIASYRGERRALRDLFAPGEPPGGAGDCAGPKLLGEAYRRGLRPIAMAEVWWGPPPVTGGRHEGGFYPACRGKCGPILPFMLEGLEVAAAPVFGAAVIAADEPRPVFEDDDVVVVDKPIDLLSVPGRSGALRDSVQTRLRARYPEATGPLVVHRLDLETSGLLLAAKSEAMYAALQAQFARREIDKRYIAWLDGEVRGDGGVIELALRVDLDDRPRQIVDAVHGKPAVTEWTVLAREGGRTRVVFVPRTGRTHQIRVHAAVGLGAPIVGDRLYGAAGDRLLLHAERLEFVHPRTGQRIAVESPAPW